MYIYSLSIYKSDMSSRLSPQWFCGNSCTWTHDVRLHITGISKPQSAQQVKQGL